MVISGNMMVRIFKVTSWVLLFIIMMNKAQGQTIALPDTNFRNVLQAKYPYVMTGDKLNITAAHNMVFDLIITYANISDLTGLEHFTSVYKIDASGNKVVKVPDLSANTNLSYIYLNSNQLTNADFLVGNKNLLQIQLYYNQLTSFPELPGFTKLDKLFLSGNHLKVLTGLAYLENLTNLQIGANQFDNLPDISKNTKLQEFHCSQNRINDLKGVDKLVNLKIFYCWGNKISDLSILNSNTSLEELYVDSNYLTTLPLLSNKPSLKKLSVQNNKLTFEDLLPLASLPGFSNNFIYAPQDSVGTQARIVYRVPEPLSLLVQTDANVTTNNYNWYKGDDLISGSSSRIFTINSTTSSDTGVYRAEITNPALPLLTLQQRSWIVRLNTSCMDVISYGYRILNQDCKEGTEIKLEVSTEGGQLPLKYSLIGKSDSLNNSTGLISNIPSGNYSLFVIDQNGCRKVVDSNLVIYRPSDCDVVISPAGSGQQNSYFIEKAGLVKILDINGKIVRVLDAPAVWDGTASDGSFVDTGYYVITVNDKKLTNISVIR